MGVKGVGLGDCEERFLVGGVLLLLRILRGEWERTCEETTRVEHGAVRFVGVEDRG